jgi:ADP-heptose:LPS heptosyltransferase
MTFSFSPLTSAHLSGLIAESDDGSLLGFGEALQDPDFLRSFDNKNILDVRLAGEPARAFPPNAHLVSFSDESGQLIDPPAPESADLIILPSVLQRVDNPYRLLRALYPLLRVGGTVLIAVPLRELFTSGRQLPSHHAVQRQKRFYTVSGLFLDLQAAWGLNSFAIRYAREFDDIGAGDADQASYTLILSVEKRADRRSLTDAPLVEIKQAGNVSAQSEDEAVMSIDLTEILSPALSISEIRKVCVIKLDHIGDFIMALPVFDEVRGMFPNAQITCICGSWNAELARSLGCFDEVVVCDYYTHNGPKPPLETALEAQRLGQRFAGVHFDITIDLRVPADSRELIRLIPSRYRAAIGNTEEFPYLDVALPAVDAFNIKLESKPDATQIFINADSFGFRGAAASPPGFRYLQPRGERSELIWGPYMALERGAYRATWLLSSAGDPLMVDVDIAVFDNLRNHLSVVHEATLEVDASGPRLSVEFELHTNLTQVEFRARAPDAPVDASLIFGGVRLERVSSRPASRHMARAQIHMKEHMSLLLALVRTRLFAPARPPADLRDRLKAATGRPGTPFFAIVPFSNSDVRSWPIDHYRQLGKLILAETNASIRLIGSESQHADLEMLRAAMAGPEHGGRVTNNAGDPWSKTYTGLIQSEAVISNNSGIAHMAGTLGARVVAIYSASHQVMEWGPLGPQITTIQASLACGACGFDTMPECLHGHHCMQMISPGSVLRVLNTVAPQSFRTASPANAVAEVASSTGRSWAGALAAWAGGKRSR